MWALDKKLNTYYARLLNSLFLKEETMIPELAMPLDGPSSTPERDESVLLVITKHSLTVGQNEPKCTRGYHCKCKG
jgi:hypothetical protein